MPDRWFYVHGALEISSTRNGPFSGRQLANLAASGQIVPTDTVWKEGIDKGVLARRVKNLFSLVPNFSSAIILAAAPATQAPAVEPEPPATSVKNQPEEKSAETVVAVLPAPEPIPDDIGLLPEDPVPPVPVQPCPPPKHVRKGRAVAGKGALIVGQDGTDVKFKKKCVVCGHEDATRNSLKIVSGTMRAGFFCPKCRKRREVEIHCDPFKLATVFE
jgi:hypothetical protein